MLSTARKHSQTNNLRLLSFIVNLLFAVLVVSRHQTLRMHSSSGSARLMALINRIPLKEAPSFSAPIHPFILVG